MKIKSITIFIMLLLSSCKGGSESDESSSPSEDSSEQEEEQEIEQLEEQVLELLQEEQKLNEAEERLNLLGEIDHFVNAKGESISGAEMLTPEVKKALLKYVDEGEVEEEGLGLFKRIGDLSDHDARGFVNKTKDLRTHLKIYKKQVDVYNSLRKTREQVAELADVSKSSTMDSKIVTDYSNLKNAHNELMTKYRSLRDGGEATPEAIESARLEAKSSYVKLTAAFEEKNMALQRVARKNQLEEAGVGVKDLTNLDAAIKQNYAAILSKQKLIVQRQQEFQSLIAKTISEKLSLPKGAPSDSRYGLYEYAPEEVKIAKSQFYLIKLGSVYLRAPRPKKTNPSPLTPSHLD